MKIAPLFVATGLALGLATGATTLVDNSAAAATRPDPQPLRVQYSDADRARAQVREGGYVPLEQLIVDAQQRFPGRVVEVELEDDVYEIEVLMRDGVKVELEYDARNGRLLETEYDD